MHKLIEEWRNCKLDNVPYMLSDDADMLAHKKDNTLCYDSYKVFVASNSFGTNSTKFHLGLIPQPYIGNLGGASIFLLMLNPGFSPGDYYAQQCCPSFREARIRNLRQENKDDEFPFFYLNPEFAWTAGGKWWQDKLRSVAGQLIEEKQITWQEAYRHMSKHIACLELCPYFSQTYNAPKLNLNSSGNMLAYVEDELHKGCEKGEKLAIVMRQKKLWPLTANDNVILLADGQARGAHLTMNTNAGVALFNELKELLS